MAVSENGLRRVKLRDCAAFQEGYVNPSQTKAHYFGDEIKWLRAVDLNDSFVFETSRRLSRSGFESAGKAALLFKPDTLAISKSGTIGRLGILKDYMCGNRAVINIQVDESVADNLFVFYTLLQNRESIQQLAEGSVQRNLYCSVLGNLEIGLPSLSEQKAIAKILSAFDDKIELNRRMNATLETMARALFKAWFVDFEPVHANRENRPSTSASPEIAKLFPSDFENGIPKGWALDQLGDHVEVLRGLSYKGAGLTGAELGVPMHNLNSIFEGGGYKYAGIKFYIGDFKERHVVRPGDVIVANTEQGHKHLLIGYPAIVPQHFGDETIFSHHIYRIRLNETSKLSRSYIYYALLTPSVREVVVGCSSGTTVNMLKIDGLQIPKLPIPSREIINAFSSFTDTIWNRTELIHNENQSLVETRDLLLPRLISGRIKVESSVAHYVEN